jgi:hypothetical protein
MQKLWNLGPLLGLLALLASAGCRQVEHTVENPGKVYPQSPSVEDTRSKEIERDQPPDIPVPRDMMLDVTGNQSFYQDKARVGRGRYKSSSVSVEDAATFYRERMPQRPYGWTLVNEQTRGGMTTMHFQKASEKVDITISPEGSETVAVVILNNQATR